MPKYTKPAFNISKTNKGKIVGDGFAFKNNFKNTIHLGIFGWSIRTSGRCGGMSYAAMDHFYTPDIDMPIDITEMPPDGDVLADYILARQLESMKSTGDEYIAAMFLPGGGDNVYQGCLPPNGASYQYFIDCIDGNRLCNIGCLPGPDKQGVQNLGEGHQILGIGYTKAKDPLDTLIHVYDNNYPGTEMILKLNNREKYWELRAFSGGQVQDEVKRIFKAWFADTGYRYVRPEYRSNVSKMIDYSNRNLQKWSPPKKEDLQNYRFVSSNFSGNNLSSCDFQNVEASLANFDNASVQFCDFRGTKLSGARFMRADLRGSTFDKDTELDKAEISHTELSDAKFNGVKGEYLSFIRAKLNNTQMNGITIKGPQFHGINAVNSYFNGVQLEDANFSYAAFNNVHFYGAYLEDPDFRDSNMANVYFRIQYPENFKKATPAQLPFADFRNAILGKVFFEGANLNNTDFRNANLNPVSFNSVDLKSNKDEKLFRTQLKRANFQNASLANCTFHRANLWKARFSNCPISNCSFKDALCNGAKFNNASLVNVDFRGAQINGADFSGANINTLRLDGNMSFANSNWRGASITKLNFDHSFIKIYPQFRSHVIRTGGRIG